MTVASLIPLVVILPLLGAASALILSKRRRAQRISALLALGAVLVVGCVLLVAVNTTGPVAMQVGGWPAPFGIVLVVDKLSALMVVVSAVVLLAVLLFSVGQGLADGDRETPVSIFFPTYLILTAGVLNAFITGDLFNLYVGFEILLVASYVLITLGGTEQRIRAGTTYIVVSLVSSMIFLVSIALIYGALGTVNIADISRRMAEVPADVQVLLHVMLLIAFGIKAAVFPLSFWLPDSYPTAPAPVTAVFAGLLTKVGVYSIIRAETIIFPGPSLNTPLMIVALLTMVVGVLGAVAQADIKRLLSFTLVSHIGYMILGVSLGTAEGTSAATYYIVHHIIVQTTLFLAAGLIERVGGTTSINKLSGLLAASPILAALFFIPALNLGGIPPFSGFLGKLALFQATAAQQSVLGYVLIGAGALVSLLTLYALVRVWSLAFWRGTDEMEDYESELLRNVSEAPNATAVQAAKRIPRLMIAATGGMVVVGVALTVFAGPLFALSDEIGDFLEHPVGYVDVVFPAQGGGDDG